MPNIENLFKHRYPFVELESEEWNNRIFEHPNYNEIYETKEVKPKGCVKDFIDGILPFVSYLQSSNNIKKVKGLTYDKSIYSILTFIEGKIWGCPICIIHDNFNFFIRYCCNDHRNASYPKEYLRIGLWVKHFHRPMEIKKYELEEYPTNAYKINQCVICLTNPSNILYNPCLHVCVCSRCNDKGEFKNCPYCRENIEEIIIIKKNSFLNKLLKWMVIVLQKPINTIL